MAMIVHVRRPRDYDCTNGGVSSTHDTLLVVESPAEVPASPIVPVMVVERHAPGAMCLRPLNHTPSRKGEFGPMAGGNYAVGDDRFNEAVGRMLGTKFYGAVAIHDRYESEELFFSLH